MNKRKQIGRLARVAAACSVAGAAALAFGFGWSPEARAEQTDNGPMRVRTLQAAAGSVRADIVIRQRQIRTDGRLLRAEGPPLALRVDRRFAQGKWRTTYTFQATHRPRVRSGNALVDIENPFLVSRVEYDEQTSDVQAYDRAGRRVSFPTDADRRRFGVTAAERGPGWDSRLFRNSTPEVPGGLSGPQVPDGIFLDSTDRDRRRLDLQRKFGNAVGRVRGLDRFVLREDDATREVLVAPTTALPAEINTARRGALASRVQLEYVAVGTLGHVRQNLRSERPASAQATDELIVTDLAMTNIEVGTGGAR
jgi:hypothetical protein